MVALYSKKKNLGTWNQTTFLKFFQMTHLIKSLSSWRGVVTTCHSTRIGHVLHVLFGTAFSNAKTLEDNNTGVTEGAREKY